MVLSCIFSSGSIESQVLQWLQCLLTTTREQDIPSKWKWYLSPWVNWRAMHWWRRRGSRRAGRKSLGGADSLTVESRYSSESLQDAASQQGPAVHHCPGPHDSRQSPAARGSPWMGYHLKRPAGFGRGPDEKISGTELSSRVTHLCMQSWRLLTIPVAQFEVGTVKSCLVRFPIAGINENPEPLTHNSDHPNSFCVSVSLSFPHYHTADTRSDGEIGRNERRALPPPAKGLRCSSEPEQSYRCPG